MSLIILINIVKNYDKLSVITPKIIFLVIYGIVIFGLVTNNKNWAWIVASLPSFWLLFNPFRVATHSYMSGTLLSLFESLAIGDPTSAAIHIQESFIQIALIIFIIINLHHFKKSRSS